MSVKTLVTLAAASAVSMAAFAGGSDDYKMASNAGNNASFAQSAYVDVNGGYNYSGMKSALKDSFAGSWKNGGDGWVFGGDLGYTFAKNMSIELGGNWFSDIKNSTQKAKWSQYDLYGAFKFSYAMPSVDGLAVYTKVGMDYLNVKYKANASTASVSANQFAPTFGLGLDYKVQDNVRATVQWRRVAAVSRDSKADKVGGTMPNQDLFTIGLGYIFPVS